MDGEFTTVLILKMLELFAHVCTLFTIYHMYIMYHPIIAAGPTLTDGDVRLINPADNTNMSGRLEVYYQGQWGTVCDDLFDNNAAMVVCRQLGLNPTGAIAVTRAGFGQGVDPIWLDNVDCTGSEENIDSCPHNAWGSHNCAHFEDAGVICLCKICTHHIYSVVQKYLLSTLDSINS